MGEYLVIDGGWQQMVYEVMKLQVHKEYTLDKQ